MDEGLRLHGTSAHYLHSITVLLLVEFGNALLNILNLFCGKSKHCLKTKAKTKKVKAKPK